jgi:hypothetical protein
MADIGGASAAKHPLKMVAMIERLNNLFMGIFPFGFQLHASFGLTNNDLGSLLRRISFFDLA